MKRWSLFCLLLVFCGLLDCVTTVIGIVGFGATEANPLLASVTETNLVAFSLMKLVATITVGISFYRAGTIEKVAGNRLQIRSRFLQIAYSLSLLALVTAVTNNVLVVAKLV